VSATKSLQALPKSPPPSITQTEEVRTSEKRVFVLIKKGYLGPPQPPHTQNPPKKKKNPTGDPHVGITESTREQRAGEKKGVVGRLEPGDQLILKKSDFEVQGELPENVKDFKLGKPGGD